MEFQEKHTISVLVENKFGVLARVAGLFSGRGYNISSLTVHETEDPRFSKMTIVTTGDAAILEQIDKQLSKLIDVIRVENLTGSHFIEREMALIKIKTPTREDRSQLMQLVEIFAGTIVSVSREEIGVEIAGKSDRIDNFIELVRDFGIVEMARSGSPAARSNCLRRPGALPGGPAGGTSSPRPPTGKVPAPGTVSSFLLRKNLKTGVLRMGWNRLWAIYATGCSPGGAERSASVIR